jgi:hypothetical protein
LPKDHKNRFIDFVHLDVPPPRDGKGELPLFNARSQKVEMYSFAKLVYAIRSVTTHENDNLDAAEHLDYHIQLDWNMRAPHQWLEIIEDERVTINAKIMSHRLREILVRFSSRFNSSRLAANPSSPRQWGRVEAVVGASFVARDDD